MIIVLESSITYSERVYSLSCTPCNAHAPYFHVWPVLLYHIFPRHINGTIFEGGWLEGGLLDVRRVSMFSTTFCMRVGTLIVATIYLQLIQNRYMSRSFTVLHCSHQHCVQPVASDVEVVVYL